MVVSIPHRYARNQDEGCGEGEGVEVFQFLIGTLETPDPLVTVMTHEMFQFLIGTLETFFLLEVSQFLFRFQFLIGTLETPFAND